MTSNIHISLQVALTLYWPLSISTTARYCLVGRCLMQHSSPHLRGSPENRNMCSIHGCAFSAVVQLGYIHWTQHIIELVDFTCRDSVDTQYMMMQKNLLKISKTVNNIQFIFKCFMAYKTRIEARKSITREPNQSAARWPKCVQYT